MASTSLQDAVVVIHGAGGAIGGAVAAAFAARGARLYLAGIGEDNLDHTAGRLRRLGPAPVTVSSVDVYDSAAVQAHTDEIVAQAGRIDVVLNAAGIPLVQGVPLLDMDEEDVLAPIAAWPHAQYNTSRAAARHMVPRRAGTILMLSASPARLAIAGVGGFSAACAAVEALTRTFAAELGPTGVRTVCLRPQRLADTLDDTPDLPMPVDEFRTFLESLTTSGTLPTLDEVARAAVFLAEGGAESMNGAVLNLTCGMSPD